MRRKVLGNSRQTTSAWPEISQFSPRRDDSSQCNPFVLPQNAATIDAQRFASPTLHPFTQDGPSVATDAAVPPASMRASPHYIGYAPASLDDKACDDPTFAVMGSDAIAQPVAVRVAYVALVVAAAAAAILSAVGVYTLTEWRESFDKVLHVDPTGTALFYASEYADNAELALIGIAAILGVLFAIAYIFVAQAIRKGRSWPRPIGTALAIFSMPAMALGPVAIAAVFAGIVAVIASWMPSARRYSAAARSWPHA